MPDGEHVSVLLEETVAALAIRPSGIYVDATYGRGGRPAIPRSSVPMVASSPSIAIPWRSARAARRRHALCLSSCLVFRLPDVLAELAVAAVDGVVLDLGISSPQIDDPARGFSLGRRSARQRMDPTRGESAAEFLARRRTRIDGCAAMAKNGLLSRLQERLLRLARTNPSHGPGSWQALVASCPRAPAGDWVRIGHADLQACGFTSTETHGALDDAAAHRSPVEPRRPPRGDQLSFARGPDREAFHPAGIAPFGGDPRLARLAIRSDALPARHSATRGPCDPPSEREVAANPRARSATMQVERIRGIAPADFALGGRRNRGTDDAMVDSTSCLAVLVVCAFASSRRAIRRASSSSSSSARRRRAFETEQDSSLEQSTWAMPGRVENRARRVGHCGSVRVEMVPERRERREAERSAGGGATRRPPLLPRSAPARFRVHRAAVRRAPRTIGVPAVDQQRIPAGAGQLAPWPRGSIAGAPRSDCRSLR
jgi:16S rRNA (cytosine1402-N4)-methyltransferase